LTIQCGERWSFVGRKTNKQWIWLAIDAQRAEMVGLSVRARDRGGAEGLWHALPAVYRQCAVAYRDFWSSYEEIFPASRHRAAGKETGGTSKIECFNNTMRQRISRLVRKTLSFSKKLSNHIGAIWLFVHHDNASLGM
jgi:insertion element IS1 protein InsB